MADAWVLSIKYALSSTGARGNVTAYDTYGRLGRWSPLQVAAASQTKPGTPHMLGGLDVIHVILAMAMNTRIAITNSQTTT